MKESDTYSTGQKIEEKTKFYSFFKISVVGRTLAGFSILTLLIIIVTYVAWNMGNQLNNSFQKLVTVGMVNVERGNYLIESFPNIVKVANSYAATKRLASLSSKYQEFTGAITIFENDLAKAYLVHHENRKVQEENMATAEKWAYLTIENARTLVKYHGVILNLAVTRKKQIQELVAAGNALLQSEPYKKNIPFTHKLNILLNATLQHSALVGDESYIKSVKALSHLQSQLNRYINQQGLKPSTHLYKLLTIMSENGLLGTLNKQHEALLKSVDAQEKMEHQMNIALTVYKLLLSQGYKSVLDGTFTADETYQSNITLLSILFIIALVIACLISIFIPRAIKKPLNKVRRVLVRLAQGDLSQTTNYKSHTEFGDLASNVDNTIENFKDIIDNISDSTKAINVAAAHNGESAKQLASSVSIQNKESNNVAAAIVELEQSFTSVADSAVQTTNLVLEAQTLVNQGVSAVEDNNTIINNLSGKLSESSRLTNNVDNISQEIGSILDVIRGVAEQTNLLALNAAIEAARAGEQGRGFSVVADEVRNLAQKTGNSTHEISEMITRLQTAVKQSVVNIEGCLGEMEIGQVKNNEISTNISAINKTIENVVDMSTHIATASEQQKQTAAEVARNINEISASAENSDNTAKKLTSLSEQLKSLASSQKTVVEQFTL